MHVKKENFSSAIDSKTRQIWYCSSSSLSEGWFAFNIAILHLSSFKLQGFNLFSWKISQLLQLLPLIFYSWGKQYYTWCQLPENPVYAPFFAVQMPIPILRMIGVSDLCIGLAYKDIKLWPESFSTMGQIWHVLMRY